MSLLWNNKAFWNWNWNWDWLDLSLTRVILNIKVQYHALLVLPLVLLENENLNLVMAMSFPDNCFVWNQGKSRKDAASQTSLTNHLTFGQYFCYKTWRTWTHQWKYESHSWKPTIPKVPPGLWSLRFLLQNPDWANQKIVCTLKLIFYGAITPKFCCFCFLWSAELFSTGWGQFFR